MVGFREWIFAVPKLTHSEITDHRAQATKVFLARVSQGNDVKPLDTSRPQVGRNDFFPRIPTPSMNIAGFITPGAFSPGVHKERRLVGQYNKNRVASATIEGG